MPYSSALGGTAVARPSTIHDSLGGALRVCMNSHLIVLPPLPT